jgi:succinylarginine dihydrolase
MYFSTSGGREVIINRIRKQVVKLILIRIPEDQLSIQDEYLECIVNEQLNISLQVHFMKDLSDL